jgi:putative peptidoglycan lipid II flippase
MRRAAGSAVVRGIPRVVGAPWAWLGRVGRREFGVREASILLAGSYLLSATLGALRQALLGHRFGADETAGAYYAAFRLPDILFTLVAGGALSSAFIPILVATRREDGEEAAWRLASLVLNALLLALSGAALLGHLLAPVAATRLLVPGYSPAGQDLATDLTRIMLLQAVILGAGTVVTALLNSRTRFLLPALAVACHNAGVIAGIGAATVWPAVGIRGPAWGVVAGAVLQVGLMLPGLGGEGGRWRPVLNLGDRRLREVARLLVPNGLALWVNSAGFLLADSFASRLDDDAAIPALHNAWLLAGLPVTLLGHAVGQAAFPRMATQAAAGAHLALRRTLRRALAASAALSLAVTAGLLLCGPFAVRVLFEHGDYGPDAADLTDVALVGFALGLPAYVATAIVTQALLALRDARTPFLSNTVQLGVRAGLMALLVPRFGLAVIPLSLAATAAVETAFLTWVVLRRLRRSAGDRP